MSSVLKQGGLCLETRGSDSLGLAECRGIGGNRPQSQVRTQTAVEVVIYLVI